MPRLTSLVLSMLVITASASLGCTTPQPLNPARDTGPEVDSGPTDGGPVCTAPQIRCGVGCVDSTSDEANCGACGNACPVTSTCTASRCVCDAGLSCLTDTGALYCADDQTDEMNCGTCGNVCDTGEACVAGECRRGCSDASDGDLVLAADMVLPAGTYDYDTITIPLGMTLSFSGAEPVILRARTVTIDGTITLDGAAGGDSGMAVLPNGGEAVGGGGGGGGGGDCGNGPGAPGMPNGGVPVLEGDPMNSAGGAGGLAAGVDATVVAAGGGGFGPGGGGGGGGGSAAGAPGVSGAVGGASFSDPEMTLFTGGGGGGGGGANGGGGGGGGGAIRISADTITVSATGRISADGGDGGVKLDGSCTSGGGGGGAGGMIWLDASLSLVLEGTLSAVGGLGGANAMTTQAGGAGALGRVQVSAPSIETMRIASLPMAVRSFGLPACP